MTPNAADTARIAALCAAQDPSRGLETLAAALGTAMPGLQFRPALSRGGWHRIGGVVDRNYGRVADHLRQWAEEVSGGDVEVLLDAYAGSGYFATRFKGTTHHLVAATGPGPWDFLQLELEETQEVIDRILIDPDWIPDDLEDLCDPLDLPRLDPEPVAPPAYAVRRLTFVGDLLAEGLSTREGRGTLQRFMDDWARSSAGEEGHFCDHWVIGLREYITSGGETRLTAKPVATHPGPIPALQLAPSTRGIELANLLHGFDRELGYPCAWYFSMLTSRQVPHAIAERVHSDLQGVYAYLPARDVKVLRDWMAKPYGA